MLLLAKKPAKWSLLGHTGGQSNNFTTAPLNTTGASLIILFTQTCSAQVIVSDSAVNTWINTVTGTMLPTSGNFNTYTVWGTLWHRYAPVTSASHTFNVNSGYNSGILVAVFKGSAPSNPLDQSHGAGTMSPGSITPTVAGELIITGGMNDTAVGSPGAPFSITDSYPLGGPYNSLAGGLAWYEQGSAAAVGPTWSGVPSGPGGAQGSVIASFKSG